MFMRQLTYLIALDKHWHFGHAAESRYVSQPALSNAIRDFERELGITIIRRNRIFQGITPEGERMILWARRMLASLDGLRQEADLIRNVPAGHLAIGVVPTAIHGATLLSAEFRLTRPRLSLEVLSLSTPVILQRLKEQELHLGLLYDRSIAGFFLFGYFGKVLTKKDSFEPCRVSQLVTARNHSKRSGTISCQ
jgi:DNA-binding transcriptional LysR family regulator